MAALRPLRRCRDEGSRRRRLGSVLHMHPRLGKTRARAHPDREPAREASHPGSREYASLLRIGNNCSAVARADRVALLVDAQAYFRAFHDAALRAKRSITILASDFNSQTRLHFDPEAPGAPPAVLGEFLNFLVRRRRGLRINVLN